MTMDQGDQHTHHPSHNEHLMDEETFTPPPKDLYTLPEIYKFQSINSPNHPVFKFTTDKGQLEVLTWSSVGLAVQRGSRRVYNDTVVIEQGLVAGRPIAIIANADTITYLMLVISLMDCGQIPFPISPRCSPAAIHHLLTSTAVTHVYVSKDKVIHDLVATVISEFHLDGLKIIPIPTFEEFWADTNISECEKESLPPVDPDSPAVILHSSGTTAFPKPIYISHRILVQRGTLTSESSFDFAKHTISLHSVAIFHAFGLTYVSRIPVSGIVAAVFQPLVMPKPVNPRTAIAAALADGCTLMACVPSILEELASEKRALDMLTRFYAVIISSGPLSFEKGEKLTKAGVRLSLYYSGTEIGCATIFLSDQRDIADWQYVRFMPQFGAHFVQQGEPDTHELIALDVSSHRIAVTNSTADGQRAFVTGDLFKRHHLDSMLWKVLGRADDQIVLSNGEKTNPTPIEHIFLRHPKISKALMFGQGRSFNGIILQLTDGDELCSNDAAALDDFRRSIKDTITAANIMAPTHSRLFKEMVLVASVDKPFALTAKGSVRRTETLTLYSVEIDNAYQQFSGAVIPGINIREHTTSATVDIAGIVQAIVHEVMGKNISAEVDLFWQGLDSLQAQRIRNGLEHMLLRRLFGGSKTAASLPRDIVYDNPTLTALINFFSHIGSQDGSQHHFEKAKTEIMTDQLHDLTCNLSEKISPPSSDRAGKAVLITGTTGSLGCHLLCAVSRMPWVSRVYAVNRPHHSGASVRHRQAEALEANGLDVSVLSDEKVVSLTIDLTAQPWNIEQSIYEEMKSTVSIVIHSAWTVDFKLKLPSFTDCLLGFRRLIEFSSEGTHSRHLIFISSLAVMRNWRKGESFTEASVQDPSCSVGLGYSESKWIAEQMLEIAAQKTGIKTTIIRAGQLSGAKNGYWKATEWFPTLIRSSRLVGCLPSIEQHVSWLPVASAAHIIAEVLHTDKSVRHLHLVNPHRASLTDLVGWAASSLQVPLIPFHLWLERLRDISSKLFSDDVYSPHDLRVLSLLEYFEEIGSSSNSERWQYAEIDVSEMTRYSHFMSSSNLYRLVPTEVERWLTYWKSVELL